MWEERSARSLSGPGHRQRRCPGQGVVALDGGADQSPALRWLQVRQALDALRLRRQRLVLDALAEPARVVALPPVVFPGVVVQAVGHLKEQHQVLHAEVEPVFRTAEVETALRRQFALGILPAMT